jgi:predicted metal-binding protein
MREVPSMEYRVSRKRASRQAKSDLSDEALCRLAERARPAMEACGIDVFTTVQKAGLPIAVVQTTRQCPNYYGLILVD